MVKREMSSISRGTNCICGAIAAAGSLWQSSERLDVLGEDAEPRAFAPALLFEGV
jgi:hypothetical protein